MSDLTVSTVILACNRAHLAERAILSALPQYAPGKMIIAVHDGFSDKIMVTADMEGCE